MKPLIIAFAVLPLLQSPSQAQSYASNWHPLGPVNMATYETSMGRVNCVTAPAGNPNRLFLGAPGGGVWRSDDGGNTWSPRSDFLPVLSISSIVLDPANPNIVYIATGDADSPGEDPYSIGVWKSVDGGTNWSSTGLSWSLTNYKVISRLLIAPDNSQKLFAATSDGVYVTYNGGTNWQRSTPGGGTSWHDIQFQPGNSSVIYLTGQGANFFRSTDGGTNWTQITAGLPGSGVDRSVLAVSASYPQGLYILYGDDSSGGFYGIYQSTNGGTSFNAQAANNLSDLMFDGQEGYDLALAVSPTNFNDVFAAGNLIGSSTDGGNTWTTATYGGTHVDVHGLAVLNGALFACTDGGIHRTIDGGVSWQDLSTGLEIAQIYNVGGAPQNPSLIYVGEQDDGLNQYNSGTWSHLLAGDFGQPIVDPTDQNMAYATAHGSYFKTTNSWASYQQLQITSLEGSAFESPLAINPLNSQTLYAGYENVWQTTNGGTSWFPISSFSDGAICTAITLAPTNPAYIYVIRNSTTWRTTDGGAHWMMLPAPAAGNPMSVAVSSSNPNRIWLAQNDFSTANKVYASSNGGTNWTAYSGTLPNRNVNCIVYEDGSNDGLYVGLDAGIYYRNASMGDWQAFNTNLPNARVVDLQVEFASLSLRAATFGRGLWESLLAGASSSLPVISGPANPVVGQANSYSFTGVSKATSYQWLQEQEFAFNIVDGAENGLTNFTAAISSGYSALSSTIKAAGNSSFHLAQPVPTDQTLTLKYPLLVQSNASIQFLSQFGFSTSSQIAEVQVSTDSGSSWKNVYTQTGGTWEFVFTNRSVSLSNYLNQNILVRFNYHYAGSSYYPQSTDGYGWYVDNIAFTNFQVLSNPVITGIPSGTNFIFTPAQAGNYLLEVRAVAYGPSYLPFGPSTVVTAVANASPVLASSISSGKLVLSWADSSFTLQQSPTLLPGSWTPVAGSSPVSVTLGSGAPKFYRLKK